MGNTAQLAVTELIKLLSDEEPIVRMAVAQALGKIGNPQAVSPLIIALGDTDWRVRESAQLALAKIGEPALSELIKALSENNPDVREGASYALGFIESPQAIQSLITLLGDPILTVRETAEEALVNIGDEKVIGALKTEIEHEQNPMNRQYMSDVLKRMERRIEIRNEIRETFHIEVVGRRGAQFSLDNMETILLILKSIPKELLSGLKTIKAETEEVLGPYVSGTVQSETILMFVPTDHVGSLRHEIGHIIDKTFFGFKAFEQLHARSKFEEDYAWIYGAHNSQEDFATTIELYTLDTAANFLRAINSAREGKPIYLEKLLFVLDVFTANFQDGRPAGATTRMYQVADHMYGMTPNPRVLTKDVAVTRDNDGKIVKIGDVDVFKPDGSYNLDELEKFFSSLVF